MNTQYIEHPLVPGTRLHNTGKWQVTELMGGLACELLYKTRDISPSEQKEYKRALHDCYPSLFLQDDDANVFLSEFRNAKSKLTSSEVDALFLDAYLDVVH